ncbi:hypothetical protein D9757_012540 [Collybiopsis confluens]|uniref:Serine aminopeptidase S33 domain-containing protein n=1 Tax=Collybiopsis confluens TaxID=2823264 RepID=A0A8H5DA12_9AGAR|nr:hypothetical protein D9757_012540 [Collybiopsis confluens]
MVSACWFTRLLLIPRQNEVYRNFSFPKNVDSETLAITTIDNETIRCHLLHAHASRHSKPRLSRTLESRNSKISSCSISTSPSVPRAVVIMFHGNGYHYAYSGQQFVRLGCDALIVSYRGYGRSSGRASEKGLQRDAQAALDHVLTDPVLSKYPIYLNGFIKILHGHSLGGALALWLASRNPDKISGLILENTFLSIPLVAKEIPYIRHFRLFIHQKWESYKRITKIPKSVAILMLSGKDDELVPESHMLKLWELASTRGENKKSTDDKSPSDGGGRKAEDGRDLFKSISKGTHGMLLVIIVFHRSPTKPSSY